MSIGSKSADQMKRDDIFSFVNSADKLLEEAASVLRHDDAATPAIMAVAYMLQAINGQLERIGDLLEDPPSRD